MQNKTMMCTEGFSLPHLKIVSLTVLRQFNLGKSKASDNQKFQSSTKEQKSTKNKQWLSLVMLNNDNVVSLT